MKLTVRYLIFVDTSLWSWRYATWFSLALGWDVGSALWEQKWKSSPTRAPGRVARRTQFFEKLNPKKSTIKMLVAEVKPCNHVVAWHIHLVKIHTSLQRKRNFEENNRLKEHDFNYQQRCMSSWMQLELGQTPPRQPNMLLQGVYHSLPSNSYDVGCSQGHILNADSRSTCSIRCVEVALTVDPTQGESRDMTWHDQIWRTSLIFDHVSHNQSANVQIHTVGLWNAVNKKNRTDQNGEAV